MGAKSIHLTLGEHLAPFQALCQKNNTSMQEVLRHFVATEIGNQKILIKGIPFGAKKLRSKRLGLNLTDAESKALAEFALQENITPGNWLIQRLQDAMAMQEGSAIGRVELKRCIAQLDKIQRDLVGMCTNLNQVARKVNSRVNPDDRIPPERLLVLKHIENTMLELVKNTQTIVERFEHSRNYPYPQKQ